MISSQDKGFQSESIQKPTTQDDLKFKEIPRFIVYKAALLREKLVLSYLIAIQSFLFIAYFIVSRVEISHLYGELRIKEYILAPGIRDFTPVSPQSIPDSYVHDAVSDFLSTLGNVNSSSIFENYSGFRRFMSDELKIKFDVETRDWIKQVQTEDLAQILHLKKKEILAGSEGAYKVTAFARADFYATGQYLGHEDQVIEMELRLIPPDPGRRWYLESVNLTWSKLETFKSKKDMNNQGDK